MHTPARVLSSALLLSCCLLPPAAAQRTPAATAATSAASDRTALPAAAPLGAATAVLSADALQASLGLGAASLQSLDLPTVLAPGQSLAVHLTLAGMDCDVVLLPHSLRAPDFQFLVQGADGVVRAQEPAPPVTYRGTIVGLPESVVAASVIDGQLHAVISLDPTRSVWGVQPASVVSPLAARALHVVYDSATVSLPDYACGTPDGPATPPPAGSFSAAGPGDKVCEIACDADVEFYAQNGSSTVATMNDVETVINAVDAIYDADVGILYSITAILVRTAEPDPYGATGAGALLNQFQQSWNGNQGGVHRDVAHLFTGKDIDSNIIGVAQLGVICSTASAYGLVQSRYTTNLAFRTALSAHELGHNWNANHCDGEGVCSIMCSGLGGCSGNITSFNTSSKAVITSKKNASSCLDDAIPPPAPVLASVAPLSVQAFQGATVTLTGTGFLKATDVTVGAVSIAATTSFIASSDTQLSFAPPAPAALGGMPVVVVGPGGSSAAKTLTYIETDPPKLSAYPFTVTSFPFPWTWGGGANDLAFLIIGLNPATFTYQSQNILATDLILSAAPLGPTGLGAMTMQLPASASGVTFYSQVVTLDAGTARASNIVTTLVVL